MSILYVTPRFCVSIHHAVSQTNEPYNVSAGKYYMKIAAENEDKRNSVWIYAKLYDGTWNNAG